MKKNVTGAQVGSISFVDEGVEHTLDYLHDKAKVNSLFISAISWARGNAGRASEGFPDHGPQEDDNLQGGAFFKPDPVYYEGSLIKHFEAPDPLYKGFDTLRDVIPKAKERNMDTYIYYCETSRPNPKSLWVPGWVHILEVDHMGRRGKIPCYNNPNYTHWWRSCVEDICKNHDVAGILWNLERKSGLVAVLDGEAPSCFCEHCMAKAFRKGIDGYRAKEGYTKLYDYVQSCKAGKEMPDGFLATFVRILMRYPEILQWENMWYESHLALAKEVYGVGKWIAPEKSFGIGIWQFTESFSFWMRSMYDYADFKGCADFFKPILYNIPAGPRFKAYVEGRNKTIFKDFESLGLLIDALYPVLGLHDQPKAENLDLNGFTPEYIGNAIQRIGKATDFQIPIFPGIPTGVPTGADQISSSPEDIKKAVKCAYKYGAKGVVSARNYSEAPLANMEAFGEAITELGLDIESEAE